MTDTCANEDDLKRRIRKLKKLEIKIRFGNNGPASDTPPTGNRRFGGRGQIPGSQSRHVQAHLVWDDFFDLRETINISARYTLKQLAAMGKDEYRDVVAAFFWNVYYRFYRENGIIDRQAYDPGILSQLGLPFDADSQTVKKRFRDLAKRHHPDLGGDAAQFIEFMEQFRKLDGY